MKTFKIRPLTRIEGEISLTIWLDSQGNFQQLEWDSDLFRGFERICRGRPVEEMPFLTSRICGICAEAHHLASTRALDQIFGLTPSPRAKKMRTVFWLASLMRDHLTVLYLFYGPDLKKTASRTEALRWLKEMGLLEEFLESRTRLKRILEIVGGRGFQALGGIPGGWSKCLTEKEKEELVKLSEKELRYARKTFDFFLEGASQGPPSLSLDTNLVALLTGSLGLGEKIGVFTASGHSRRDLSINRFRELLIEEDSPLAPNLRTTRLKGLGPYLVGPLARFSLWPSPETPLAREARESLKNCFDHLDYHATHLIRAYEVLWAGEKMKTLVPQIETHRKDESPSRVEIQEEGIGLLEAPRGLLIHHYQVDPKGILREVNIITPTAQNMLIISQTIKKCWPQFRVQKKETLIQKLQSLIRTFDPCIPCMLHLIYPSRGSSIKVSWT